jgi:hypothetical protein
MKALLKQYQTFSPEQTFIFIFLNFNLKLFSIYLFNENLLKFECKKN